MNGIDRLPESRDTKNICQGTSMRLRPFLVVLAILMLAADPVVSCNRRFEVLNTRVASTVLACVTLLMPLILFIYSRVTVKKS